MFSRVRTPRQSLAFEFLLVRRVSGSRHRHAVPVRAVLGLSAPPNGFCKRSVPVASCSVLLRPRAYESSSTPKNVLLGTFTKTRRAASTVKFSVMSGRLAHTLGAFQSAFSSSEGPMPSRSVEWRSLHSVVTRVLRSVRTAPSAAEVPVKAVEKILRH